MEAAHLARLREEQDKAILETDQRIAQWEEMKSNYKALQDRLNSLSHKTSHDIMVPFGPCAFMPGKIVHTNEIMVLLGDNWFVERSSKQAAEIAGRRLTTIDKSIHDLNEQKKLLQPRVDVTSELQNISQEKDGVREIVENYDSEEERIWKEKHRKNVQLQKKKEKLEREKIEAKNEKKKVLTDEELWARLDELEEIETKGKELQRLRVEEVPSVPSFLQTQPMLDESTNTQTSKKHIQWQDNESDDSYDEQSDDNDIVSTCCTNRITFTHTPVQNKSESSEECNESTPENITSPSDVYKYFGHLTQPKSILKKEKKQSVRKAREAEIEETRNRASIKKMSDTAFTGTILEKSAETLPKVKCPTPMIQTTETNKRPVSKFRASRQK
ncbi:unconventional prefoldin RPB5 interactor [Patella vulgata]|uniref:unconventional prefoldin RPB5 interactor n=1 Tax=Patella vulgata TaxID=6465 RepID=UPI00217F97FF|nr:unconventional prefoldin RPB5 interactor [Patella vulgata]XP_050399195.1 unconventional prefoldin RPB5 interactor [Patella vulgata]